MSLDILTYALAKKNASGGGTVIVDGNLTCSDDGDGNVVMTVEPNEDQDE